MKEVWRPIPNFGGYEVSDLGRVRSFRRNTTCATILLSKDRINLRKNNKTYPMRVCYLVALAFIGPRPKNNHVRHLNDDRSNNEFKNIRRQRIMQMMQSETDDLLVVRLFMGEEGGNNDRG